MTFSGTKVVLKNIADLFPKNSNQVKTFANTNQVKAFARKFDPEIGEELTHKITGQRFFRNADIYVGPPRELTQQGYRGITLEEFEALKRMRITRDEHGTIIDDFTGKKYWNTLGLPMAKDGSGHMSISQALWEKIQSLV